MFVFEQSKHMNKQQTLKKTIKKKKSQILFLFTFFGDYSQSILLEWAFGK